MKKIKTTLLILMLSLSSFAIISADEINPLEGPGDRNVINVGGSGPGNYSSIQEAVDIASEGDTIFVYDDSSPYVENVVINTPIDLVGENKLTTVIDGNGNVGLIIAANNTTVSNFKIINCDSNPAMRVSDKDDYLVPVYNNSVDNIVFENNEVNLFIVGDNHIIENISSIDVDLYDIICVNSHNNFLRNNDLNEPGIIFYYFGSNTDTSAIVDCFYHDIDTSNTVNGNPIYYYRDVDDVIVPKDAGEILAVNCNNMKIDDINNPILVELAQVNDSVISNNSCNIYSLSSNNNEIIQNTIEKAGILYGLLSDLYTGFALKSSSNNNIVRRNTFTCPVVSLIINGSNNDIIYNDFLGDDGSIGIAGNSCSHNYISNNTVSNKSQYGIYLYLSNNDEVCNNFLSDNEHGIKLSWSDDDVISGNSIIDNDYGIYFDLSDDNLIYNNYFENDINAYDKGVNLWNISKTLGANIVDGSYLGGNFWDDYYGYDLDGDGLGDTDLPYDSDGNIQNGGDEHPLVYDVPKVENVDTGETFDTIQAAIDAENTTNGHTITVRPGTYYENVIVNKSINLIGEDRDTTIIDGQGDNYTIELNSINIMIGGFTIQNTSSSAFSAGVYIRKNSATIKDSIIKDNPKCGIKVGDVGEGHYSVIKDNTIENNGIGINLWFCDYHNITGNDIINNNVDGILVEESYNNLIFSNLFESNGDEGIQIWFDSSDSLIYNNTFVGNGQNAYDSSNNSWDNGSIGNSWDDYDNLDSDGDGIGDVPYDIPGGDNQDRYPLGVFNLPPTADAGGPYSADENVVITFNGSDSNDPDGSIVGYRWDFDNDGTYDTDYSTSATATHSYSSDGTYTVKLQVKDDDDLTDTDTATVTINEEEDPEPKPVADAGGPYFEFVGVNIVFDGSDSNESEGIIESYEWDFGDGANGTGKKTNHTYTTSGNFTVTLKVTNDAGQSDSDTTYAIISDTPNTPPNDPTISGPQILTKNMNYTFEIRATDPDGDNLDYIIRWGDKNSTIAENLSSGTVYEANHSWSSEGVYTIKVRAEDNDTISDTTSFTVYVDIPIEYIDDVIQGYMIDYDNDGIFDKFFNSYTEVESYVQKLPNGTYLIDIDNDRNWDYYYDIENNELTVYQSAVDEVDEEKEKDAQKNKELGLLLLVLIGIIIVILIVIILYIIIRYILNKKKLREEK